MPLIFTDTLQATDSTGLYTLQALIGSTWTDVHTIAGPQSGSIEIDASLNTITVDTALLPVGHTFQFRWIDSLGNQSNIITALVPFTLTDSYYVLENISYTNGGGDSWTFTVPFTPPANDSGDTISNQVVFYDGSVNTVIADKSGITTDRTYSFSGRGAGTYNVIINYNNSGGTHAVISQIFLMVDAAGNVIREAIFSGFTGVSLSGMDISCTANYQLINASSIPAGTYYVAISMGSGADVQLSSGNPLVNEQLPSLLSADVLLLYIVGLDPAEWTPGLVSDAVTACAMTLSTNIIS